MQYVIYFENGYYLLQNYDNSLTMYKDDHSVYTKYTIDCHLNDISAVLVNSETEENMDIINEWTGDTSF